MGDTTTFPSINPLDGGREGVILNPVAGGTIKAGQVVAFNATGVAKTVEACNGETTTAPIGVALYDATTGQRVAVASTGSVVTVCEGPGAGCDAGDLVGPDDAAVLGCIKTVTSVASASVIGIALDDIPANGTGQILVQPFYLSKAAS